MDQVLGLKAKFGIGFGLPSKGMPMRVNDRTLFWAGWGGWFAVVDVENQMTVVDVMNRMQDGAVGGARSSRVIFSAHEAAAAIRGDR